MDDLDLRRRYISTADAAVYTGLSKSTIERAVREGRLRAGGTPRRRRFLHEWLDAWMLGDEARCA